MRSSFLVLILLSLLGVVGCGEAITFENFGASLTGAAEVPPVTTNGSGSTTVRIEGQTGNFTLNAQDLTTNITAAHIHGPAPAGQNAGVLVPLSGPRTTNSMNISGTFGPSDIAGGMSWDTFVTHLRNGMLYVNVHTTMNPGGEVRGQLARQ